MRAPIDPARLHPTLPTIITCESIPPGEIALVPPFEWVTIYAPDGSVIADEIKFERKSGATIRNISIPKC